MLYADTVESPPLVHRPRFLFAIWIIALIAFWVFGLHDTLLGHLLRPVMGEPSESGIFGAFAVALVLSIILVLNVVLIGFLSLRIQIFIVWLELLILFMGFFYTFNLDLSFIATKLPFMVTQGVFTTLYVSALSISFASAIAIIGAVAKLSSNGFAFAIASFYTSFFRGLPLLMQIYLIYLGMPQLGFVIGAVPAGVLALSLCYGAYMTEIFRAGIQSIDKGQWEAARASGMGFSLIMQKIILPQALPTIIPPTGNQFIAMLKDSSLVSVVGVWELMFLARTMGQKTFQHMEMLLAAALIYWVLTILLELIQSRIEKHFNRSKV